MAVKPISPAEVGSKQAEQIPDFVLEAFNAAIAKNYIAASRSSTVKQNDVVEAIVNSQAPSTGFDEKSRVNFRCRVFNDSWLNVEAAYEAAGWKVEYNKPGYNESYAATFVFKKKR